MQFGSNFCENSILLQNLSAFLVGSGLFLFTFISVDFTTLSTFCIRKERKGKETTSVIITAVHFLLATLDYFARPRSLSSSPRSACVLMEKDQCQSNKVVDMTTQETILAMNALTLTPVEENLGLTPDYDSSVSPDDYLPPTPPGSPSSHIQTTISRRRFDTEIVLRDFPPLRCPAKAKFEKTPSAPCLRVLLVDDNHVNLRILERLLNRHLSHIIHQVRVAQDASQALDLLSTNDFDMVMMDIEMPGMSGVQATARIRAGEAGERHCTIPIVAVTTKDSPYWRSLYLENGMNGCISKPIVLDSLLETVNDVLCRDSIESLLSPISSKASLLSVML
ncbi:hypothetical protein INT43_004442 [Umbelopsis isabellina]|uniref:Response regulatory domain-containing protein n=1 Tax=Mortierella isabellina TaxID=91625 RepID=A0A8H7PI08_MORIS|nr:hypothetical protein INT43_004442 [Umbelopsis isabellina]